MPVRAGVAGAVYGFDAKRRISADAEGKAGVSPDAQRASDGSSASVDGDSVCGAQNRTELRAGQGDFLFTEALDELTLFLRQPGAPLDNNIVERALKKAILHRKNALFIRR